MKTHACLELLNMCTVAQRDSLNILGRAQNSADYFKRKEEQKESV